MCCACCKWCPRVDARWAIRRCTTRLTMAIRLQQRACWLKTESSCTLLTKWDQAILIMKAWVPFLVWNRTDIAFPTSNNFKSASAVWCLSQPFPYHHPCSLSAVAQFHHAPLHVAALNARDVMVSLLLASGADVNAKGEVRLYTSASVVFTCYLFIYER